MLKKSVTSLLLLPFAAGLAFAQGPNTSTTMVCRTSDGTIRITDQAITVADYRLRYDGTLKDGVLRFTDASTGAVAVLDARDSDGLYLEVREGGQTMQLVAATADIRYESTDRETEPASPTLSSVLTLIRHSRPSR